MLIPATQLRVGMTVEHNKDLWRVMNVVHVTPGNWRGMVQTKLRNLRSGTQTENRFRSEDKVERVTLEQHEMEFLYESDAQYHFMNTETYDQIALEVDLLGDAVSYLTPNSRIQVEFHDGKPMGVSLPKTVDLKVVETAPGLKSATVTNVLQPAETDPGRLRRRDLASRQDQTHRELQGDVTRQPMHAARGGHEADARLGKAQARRLPGHDDVAGKRDLEATAEGDAVHRGDQRLPQ